MAESQRATISINKAVSNFIKQNDLPKSLQVNLIKRVHQNIATGRIEAPAGKFEGISSRPVYLDSVNAFLYEVKK